MSIDKLRNSTEPPSDSATASASFERVSSKTRLQFDLSQHQLDQLEALMRSCAVDTKKELFNSALTLLAWAVEEVSNGKSIASVDKDRRRIEVLKMPVFFNAEQISRTFPSHGEGLGAKASSASLEVA